MKNHNQQSLTRFVRDVAKHQMTVLRDDGVHRHLRFKNPESGSYWFDLITWPGVLCIDGDMGTLVFKRLHDMFEFFRTDRVDRLERKKPDEAVDLNDIQQLERCLNLSYWAEKVQAAPLSGIREFDEERFQQETYRFLVEFLRDVRDRCTREERRELWEHVRCAVWQEEGGERKRMGVYDFHHTLNRDIDFEFRDFWEVNVERWTSGYLWNCCAIAWGVWMYQLPRPEGRSL